MSIIAVIAIVKAIPMIKVTNIPERMAGDVMPTQSYALLNLLTPGRRGCT